MWWNDLRVSSPLYLLTTTRRLPKHKCKPKDLDGNNPQYARVHVRLNSMIIDRSVTGRNPAPVEIKWNLEQAWRFFILNGARILPSTVAHLQTAQFFRFRPSGQPHPNGTQRYAVFLCEHVQGVIHGLTLDIVWPQMFPWRPVVAEEDLGPKGVNSQSSSLQTLKKST